MKYNVIKGLAILFLSVISTVSSAQPFGSSGTHTPVEAKQTGNTSKIGYWEFLPPGFDANSGERYPLLIFIHGRGERGNGGLTDLQKIVNAGITPPTLIQDDKWLNQNCLNEGCQKTIVISPQSYGAFSKDALVNFYNYLKSNYPIDVNRVYLTGLSSGGEGVAKFVQSAPDVAAAILPVAQALAIKDPIQAARLSDLPVWSHVGYLDNVVSRGSTSATMDILSGFSPKIDTYYPVPDGEVIHPDPVTILSDGSKWVAHVDQVIPPTHLIGATYYSTVSHNTWSRTYSNEDVWDWLFSQVRVFKETVNVYTRKESVVVDLASDSDQSVRIYGSANTSDYTEVVDLLWIPMTDSDWVVSTPNSLSTFISNLTPGVHSFRLSASHINGDSDSEDVIVVANNVHIEPISTVVTSEDTESIEITAVGVSANGTVLSYNWEKNNSSDVITLSNSNDQTVTLANLVEGSYELDVTATDEWGIEFTQTVIIEVLESGNTTLTANAGVDQLLTYHEQTAQLSSSASSGEITTREWVLISKEPENNPIPIIGDISAENTTISNLKIGSYVYQINVKLLDIDGNVIASDVDEVTIIVQSPIAPIANAGNDTFISLPDNTVSLSSELSTGDIDYIQWTLVSVAPNTNISPIITGDQSNIASISNLEAGEYVFELELGSIDTDGNVIFSDTDQVVVVLSEDDIPIEDGAWLELEVKSGASGKLIGFYYDDNQSNANMHTVSYPTNNQLQFKIKSISEEIDLEKIRVEVVMRYQTRVLYAINSYIISQDDDWTTYALPLEDFNFDVSRLDEGGRVSLVSFKATSGIGTGSFGLDEIIFTGGDLPLVWYGDEHDIMIGETASYKLTGADVFNISEIHEAADNPEEGESWIEIEAQSGSAGKYVGFYFDENQSNANTQLINYPHNNRLDFAIKTLSEGLNVDFLRVEVVMRYQTRVLMITSNYIIDQNGDWTFFSIPLEDFNFDASRLDEGGKISLVSFKTTSGFGIGNFGLDEVSFSGSDSPVIWYGQAHDLILGASGSVKYSDSNVLSIVNIHDDGGAIQSTIPASIFRLQQEEEIKSISAVMHTKVYDLSGTLLNSIDGELSEHGINFQQIGLNPGLYILHTQKIDGSVESSKVFVLNSK